jgi:osmotically inducible lipoprotein OsmB
VGRTVDERNYYQQRAYPPRSYYPYNGPNY